MHEYRKTGGSGFAQLNLGVTKMSKSLISRVKPHTRYMNAVSEKFGKA